VLFFYKNYLTYHILVLELVKLVPKASFYLIMVSLFNEIHCTFLKKKKKNATYICFQEKVVFVTCEDDDTIKNTRLLEGKYVRLGSILLTYHSILIWTVLLPCHGKKIFLFLE